MRLLSGKVIAGLSLIIIGAAVGFFGASTPISSASQQRVSLVSTAISVAPNDYSTQSLELTKGESVLLSLGIENETIFTLDVMNQTQYYIYYSCAPKCAQPLLGGNGSYYQQAGEAMPYDLNVSVTPSSPYSGEFNAPSNGTYYFLFDNTVGASWGNYIGQNSTGPTDGQFSISAVQSVKSDSINWGVTGLGSAITIGGGAFATVMWDSKSKT